ncbi:hypothetical protein AJ85_15810 [Alkalihalobacillus alcalophilus ATCC 27647 = CGMCC 1.3604]|uniref:2-oxoisovalerate dehydrogenase subunit alpha n=1 Tax=Alkalihalobacillus alcalophilus ATCC 27647 = CGMCC 1.3604 TaxID=1218173 RepID=A0A4S4JWQ5_ALKAL|nr:thiamine pyrophosphate-dependent enzyme [Alkalihalobacillus alcalophilus]MED1560658.1 thiamine pyrophosphate-dependent enzyme [Alkalihalobacillus alcalophilus]THG89676.1 hypothetical protein AJ85_15810 [Alkalihalobacillus alcalophilus ATCC 27647 = CGMCC 1.3604]
MRIQLKVIQFLDESGNLMRAAKVELTDEQLIRLYKKMLLARLYDERAIRLQRQGRIGTYPSFGGHEAAQVGSVFALKQGDWLFPYGRDLAACLAFGMDIKHALLYAMGHKEGVL